MIPKTNKLYNKTPYTSILHDIDGLLIPLDPQWNNIGICMSGGADSALLTYILCHILEKNNIHPTIHIITNIRMWKLRPWQEFISNDVFNWFVNRFSFNTFIRHENFVPPIFEWGNNGATIMDDYGKMRSGDQLELMEFSLYTASKYKLDAWFSGVNKNPSIKLSNTPFDRDQTITDDTDPGKIIKLVFGTIMCHPFRYIEKDWIYKQYVNFDILDLFNITRSCEGDNVQFPEIFNGLDYKTYIPGQYVPICNKCFWCEERNWSIRKINGKI